MKKRRKNNIITIDEPSKNGKTFLIAIISILLFIACIIISILTIFIFWWPKGTISSFLRVSSSFSILMLGYSMILLWPLIYFSKKMYVKNGFVVFGGILKKKIPINGIDQIVTIYSVIPKTTYAYFFFDKEIPMQTKFESQVSFSETITKDIFLHSDGKWYKYRTFLPSNFFGNQMIEEECQVSKKLSNIFSNHETTIFNFWNRQDEIDTPDVNCCIKGTDIFLVFKMNLCNRIDRTNLDLKYANNIVNVVLPEHGEIELNCGSFIEFLDLPDIRKKRDCYRNYYYRFQYVIVPFNDAFNNINLQKINGTIEICGSEVKIELKYVGFFDSKKTDLFDVAKYRYELSHMKD